MSIDALFGLPRKKSGGNSFRDAIHGHLFFAQQERVDEHVAMASLRHKKEPKIFTIILLYILQYTFELSTNVQ